MQFSTEKDWSNALITRVTSFSVPMNISFKNIFVKGILQKNCFLKSDGSDGSDGETALSKKSKLPFGVDPNGSFCQAFFKKASTKHAQRGVRDSPLFFC